MCFLKKVICSSSTTHYHPLAVNVDGININKRSEDLLLSFATSESLNPIRLSLLNIKPSAIPSSSSSSSHSKSAQLSILITALFFYNLTLEPPLYVILNSRKILTHSRHRYIIFSGSLPALPATT